MRRPPGPHLPKLKPFWGDKDYFLVMINFPFIKPLLWAAKHPEAVRGVILLKSRTQDFSNGQREFA